MLAYLLMSAIGHKAFVLIGKTTVESAVLYVILESAKTVSTKADGECFRIYCPRQGRIRRPVCRREMCPAIFITIKQK